LEQAEHKKL